MSADVSSAVSTAEGAAESTAAGGGAAPAAPRFQMLGAAGLACDGDVCAVPAQPAGTLAEAPAEAPAGVVDAVRRVAADG